MGAGGENKKVFLEEVIRQIKMIANQRDGETEGANV